MADITSAVKKPALAGVAAAPAAVSASDTFTAAPDSSYILVYSNGATTTGAAIFKIVDETTPEPAAADLAAGWADAITLDGTLGASSERAVIIPNTNRFRGAGGAITLEHTGTLTTVTLSILGPFPPVG